VCAPGRVCFLYFVSHDITPAKHSLLISKQDTALKVLLQRMKIHLG